MKKIACWILMFSMLLSISAFAEDTTQSIVFLDKILGITTYQEVIAGCSPNVQSGEKVIDTIYYAGYQYNVEYSFLDDKLTSVYLFTENFADEQECEDKFNQLNMAMMDAYGIPKAMDDSWGFYAWKPMYQNQMGTAMYKGMVSRVTTFDIPGYTIKINFGSEKRSSYYNESIRLSATIKKERNIQFDIPLFKSNSKLTVSTDEISGNVYIYYSDNKNFRFEDNYTKNYYSHIYPDIICVNDDGKLVPVFRMWVEYRSTDSLFIDDILIRVGDTTWTFNNCNIDYPTAINDKYSAYETLEKGLIRFDIDSVELLESIYDYNETIEVRMTSSNSTDTRTFMMPQGTIDAFKELYQIFKTANGADVDFLEAVGGNTCEKKVIKIY